MIRARLTDTEAATLARRLDAYAVAADDPRLAAMDPFFRIAALVSQAIAETPAVVIVEWPDTARAYVMTWPNAARQAQALVEAYGKARALLEQLELDSAVTSGAHSH